MGGLFGLGPPRFGSLLQGGGLSLGVLARAPRGLVLGVRLRYLARTLDGRRLARLRIAPTAGWSFRIGRFELPLTGEIGIEPWLVIDDEGRVPRAELGAPGSSAVLIGAAARLQPGWLVRPRPTRVAAVRLGLDAALGGAFVLDEGPKVATLRSDEDPDSDPLYRLGGLEAYLGVGATIWFSLARR